MKLVIREYLEALRERDELDAILPPLLSELGFTVLSRPTRGTRQFGVDVAATGIEGGEKKLFLFSIKQGDLNRDDWDQGNQSLRPSLNEILDVYIPNRVLAEHAALKIVICLCFGGEIVESMREVVKGFTDRHTDDRISFQEWNGDKLAGLITDGPLRQELLPPEFRRSFQKAVAMVDEPEISFHHFARLIDQLASSGSPRERLARARQMYLCLWVLFVWARDADNVEAAYLANEQVILRVWQMYRDQIGRSTKVAQEMGFVVKELVDLHSAIWDELVGRKVLPHVGKLHALSVAVDSASPVDVNLKLFDLLGRISLHGLWMMWLEGHGSNLPTMQSNWQNPQIDELAGQIVAFIENNQTLLAPIADAQVIDLVLALMFLRAQGRCDEAVATILEQVTRRSIASFITHRRYPNLLTDYSELLEHPRERTDTYREEVTAGSVLYPTLAVWAACTGNQGTLDELADFAGRHLQHCNFQLWVPDATTEERFFLGDTRQGSVLSSVPISNDADELRHFVEQECLANAHFGQLSSIANGHWPLVLIACRHFRIPVPPQLWLSLFTPS